MNGVEIMAIRIDKLRLHGVCQYSSKLRWGLPVQSFACRHFTARNFSVSNTVGDSRLNACATHASRVTGISPTFFSTECKMRSATKSGEGAWLISLSPKLFILPSDIFPR